MALPTWEIAIIVIIVLTLAAIAIWAFVRCCKSMVALGGEPSNKRQNDTRQDRKQYLQQQKQHIRASRDVTETYGVPYRSPEEPPQQLDPSKLQAVVMEGKSDLHPHYLEKRAEQDNFVVPVDDSYLQKDPAVVWTAQEVLIESEFLPARLQAYNNPSFSSDAESQRPKKKVVISYNRGIDGAPEIKSLTTNAPVMQETKEGTTQNAASPDVNKSAHAPSSHVGDSRDQQGATNDIAERRVLHVSRDWVEFDKEENGYSSTC